MDYDDATPWTGFLILQVTQPIGVGQCYLRFDGGSFDMLSAKDGV